MAIIGEAGGLHRTRAGHDDKASMSREQEKDAELESGYGTYKKAFRGSRWLPVKARRSRMLLTVAVLGAMFLLFQILPGGEGSLKQMTTRRWSNPSDDVERFPGEDGQDEVSGGPPLLPQQPVNPSGAPPLNKKDPNNADIKHYYNDVIRFFNLAGSLHKISRTGGFKEYNRNVLFAASTLKSVSALLPLACEMRRWDRNTVHIAIFGRDDITVEEIREVNGVDAQTCDIYWHDARPDYAPYSTELRAETGATFAFKSINEFMHPQAVITNDLDEEDHFFKAAVHRMAETQGHTVIQIPEDAADKLSWIARLDVEPLREWHDMSVEILVHAPPNSVGSLRRLMASLNEADYTGLAFPRLTFEIPVDVDPMLRHFLEGVRWPPEQRPQLERRNMLTIRHRIPSRKISAEEASIRFVESFYPTQSKQDHVLVVSPNAELSPLYYQYIIYNILQYRSSDRMSDGTEHLLGISLDVPTTLLDGSTPLDVPDASYFDRPYDQHGHHNGSVPFLWEAPNSGAALYFGDKWAEIHSFITNRIVPRKGSARRVKEVSAALPSWLEYFLELTRARGYAMLYPSLEGETTLVTVHHESTHRPEEFDHRQVAKVQSDSADELSASTRARAKRDVGDIPDERPVADDNDPFITPASLPPPIPEQNEASLLVSDTPLTKMLPNEGDLLPLDRLPFLTHAGKGQSRSEIYDIADGYAQVFRKEQGGCAGDKLFDSGKKRRYVPGSANDLFCSGEETEADYINDADSVEMLDVGDIFPELGDAIGAREFPIKADSNGEPPLTPPGGGTIDVAAQAPLAGGAVAAGLPPGSAPLAADVPLAAPLAGALPIAAAPALDVSSLPYTPPGEALAVPAPGAGELNARGSLDNAAPLAGDTALLADLPPASPPIPGEVAPPANLALAGDAAPLANLPPASLPIPGDIPPPVNLALAGDAAALANLPPANLPIPGDIPPAVNLGQAGDIPTQPPAEGMLPPAAGLNLAQGAGSLSDPAVIAQLEIAGVPPAAAPLPYNLPKKPSMPHEQHKMNQIQRVREKGGGIVAVPSDV